MAGQKMSDYETIRAAVSVEKWAVDKVAACYKEEIDRQATIKKPVSYTHLDVYKRQPYHKLRFD